ncbi:MAG TPA: hypothetical protein VFN48_08510, partial [Solirubrobacteraceae bacterium]|nr:hypothetical protein [Solirubrobacteraceae bacterium]
MTSFGEVARVAVIAEDRHLGAVQRRLLSALARAQPPGFQVGLARGDTALGPLLDLIQILGPGPAAATAAIAREHGLGLLGAFPLPADLGPGTFHRILSPTAAADRELLAAGAHPEQLHRWQPGVDPESFGPGYYCASALP